ncbi:MAG TPA: long-chain fatty acid--CoA ligase [Solirubrobacteraceae bacterium]|nr:long-chain fatty acid--CoA ligase [Solirubrobacteraceae bacterium]
MTVAATLLAATTRHADAVALRVPAAGGWEQMRFAELGRAARALAAGLIGLGVEPGDRVAILGATRPEWTLADLGALCAGAVVVPVYHTNSAAECEYVLAHAGARVVICEDAAQVAKVDGVRERLPELEHVITMEQVAGRRSLSGLGAGHGDDGVGAAIAAVSRDDVATIVYTSGTTGPPKGCELTHANLLATARMYESVVTLGPGAVIFMFLPLAHALARVVQLVALETGATLSFWSRDPARLLDDLGAAEPTHFPSVPRVFEKIHTRALAAGEDGPAIRRRLMRWALRTGAAASSDPSPSPWSRAQHRLADRLVLQKVRNLFGGSLQLALTGAAPIAEDVLAFFDACGIPVLEGYGLTETCAAATLNPFGAARFGTVGRALPGADVRIADDGEVLLRGPMVFRGYRADQDATATSRRGDWLCTGDVGSLDPDGYLSITGRKKDLIITSSGKNIAPANLESALRESRWIGEAVVLGDGRPYLVALLTLDPDEIPALAARLGLDPDLRRMAGDPRVRAAVGAAVGDVNASVARIEQIKRFAILDEELTQDEGELTPTLKVKRAAVAARFADRIAGLYAQ